MQQEIQKFKELQEIPKKFIIDRATWRCGGDRSDAVEYYIGEGETALLNEEGFMCCLGQAGLQCGFQKEEIKNKMTPAELKTVIPEFTKKTVNTWRGQERTDILNDDLSSQAMSINDQTGISQSERESKLTALFKLHGLEIEFINEAVVNKVEPSDDDDDYY